MTLYKSDGSQLSNDTKVSALNARTLHVFLRNQKPETPLADVTAPCCYFVNVNAAGARGVLLLENPRDVMVESVEQLRAQVMYKYTVHVCVLYNLICSSTFCF